MRRVRDALMSFMLERASREQRDITRAPYDITARRFDVEKCVAL
jgi:hypothetical protein